MENIAVGVEECPGDDDDNDDVFQGQVEGSMENEEDCSDDEDDNDEDAAQHGEVVAPAAPAAPVGVVVNAPVEVNVTVPATVTVNAPVSVTVSAPPQPPPPPVLLQRTTVLKMKLAQLKSALTERGLNPNGKKTELVLRLIDAYDL